MPLHTVCINTLPVLYLLFSELSTIQEMEMFCIIYTLDVFTLYILFLIYYKGNLSSDKPYKFNFSLSAFLLHSMQCICLIIHSNLSIPGCGKCILFTIVHYVNNFTVFLSIDVSKYLNYVTAYHYHPFLQSSYSTD